MYLQEQRRLAHAPGDHLQIMVNWLHAASHDFQCQIKNSGRYREGACWAVGEQAEQLWALTNVSALLSASVFSALSRVLGSGQARIATLGPD